MATTTEFLAHLRRLATLPAQANSNLTDADLLAHADLCVSAQILPLIRRANQEYLVRDVALTSVGGRVDMPLRSVVAGARLVQLVVGTSFVPLPMLPPESDVGGPGGGGLPFGFYWDGAGIVLLPRGSSGTLKVRYYARPGKMVLDASGVGRVTSVSVGATSTTINFAPNLTTGSVADVISNGPAHQPLVFDAAFTPPVGSLVVPNGNVMGTVNVGDWVTQADTSPVVPLPEELMSALVHATAAAALVALGYREAAPIHEARAERALALAAQLLQPRSDGNPKRMTGGILGALGGGYRGPPGRW